MTELNKNWWMTQAINFKLRMNGSHNDEHTNSSFNCHYWSAPKVDVVSLFCSLFSDVDYRGLYKCGKVESAEYVKQLLKAYSEGDLEVQIVVACVELIRSQTLRPSHDFLTVRLVGKKLLAIWEKVYAKNNFRLDETIDRVLEIQFSNLDNEPFVSFLNDNRKELNALVRDYENDRKPDFL